MRLTVEVSLHSHSVCALKLFSEWYECSEHVSIYNYYEKKIAWQFDVEVMWHKI